MPPLFVCPFLPFRAPFYGVRRAVRAVPRSARVCALFAPFLPFLRAPVRATFGHVPPPTPTAAALRIRPRPYNGRANAHAHGQPNKGGHKMIGGLIVVFVLMGGLFGYIIYDCVRMGRNIKKMRKQLRRN